MYQEEHQQFVGEDQEQVLEQNLTNFVDTQGKHQKHITLYLYLTFMFMQAPVHLKTRVFYTSLSFMQFI